MIQIIKGDILSADAEALVNTVNCAGVMGRGIALQFKKKFEENFKVYKKACDAGFLRPGMMLVHDYGSLFNPRYIINFPTKDHWRANSKIEDIESGLVALVLEIRKRGIKSVAIPPLGCGLGGLSWSQVRPRIEAALNELTDVQVLLFEPAGAPAVEAMTKRIKIPNMTVGRGAMIGLMRQYLSAVMDPFITLLEVHKLMYFLTACGEPIPRLNFRKGPYGPYSENLRHVLNDTEGYFTRGFGDGEDDPNKPIELLPNGIEQAEAFLEDREDTRQHLEKVSDLIAGFETPYGMELLATVHWVASRDGAKDSNEALRLVHAWSDRKKGLFPPRHVELAWNVLHQKQLLPS